MAIKIKRYNIKEQVKIQDILDDGFNYSVDCKYLTKFTTLKESIVLCITIPLKDICSFNDYDDVDVLDDDFCQPYMPFYDNYKEENTSNNFLMNVVKRYNEEMDNIKIFKEDL